MNWTLAEVLDAARALPRAERAQVAQELIATLESTNESDESRYAELQEAVKVGLDQLDQGQGIEIPSDSLDAYIRDLGQLAADRPARHTA